MTEIGEKDLKTSEEELKTRELYLQWIEQYCNDKFDRDNLHGGILLALDQLIKIDPFSFNVTSEKLSDMSQSFSDNQGGMPKYIYNWINVYKRLRTPSQRKRMI